jgi:integrase
MARRRPELATKTVANYEWALSNHLLPFFAEHRLPEITVEEVDRYKSAKLREGRIGANQINTTLTRLAQVLEDAVEYGHIERNPARGRRRRVKGTRPHRSWVEPEQLLALLGGANTWHRPILATLAGAGLRAGEAVALNWGDISLATATLTVRRSKTDAGTGRRIDLPVGLHEELLELKARSDHTGWEDPVFLTRGRSGRVSRQTVSNVGRRLKTAIKHANLELMKLGVEPISDNVTPHSLRRTYASVRFALGDDPVYVADQLGHTEAAFSMEVYAKAVKRRTRLSEEHLRRFDDALEWARMGTIESLGGRDTKRVTPIARRETAQ